jgi:ABC-type multidrug transport system fused ATPase/permease subunit
MFILSLIALLYLDYKLAISMTLASGLLFFIASFFTKKSTALEQELSSTNEDFTTDMSNTFNGIEILKLNNIEDKFLMKSMKSIDRVEKKKYAANVFSELQRNIIRIFAYLIMVFVLFYLSKTINKGMSLATAVFLFQLSSSMSNFLINAFPTWNLCKASISIYEKIAKPEEVEDVIGVGTKEFQFLESIHIKNMSFSYDNKTIFKDADFTIKKGKKYLIKGVSGAGKSTLMNLLAMIYDDYEGQILVDGVDYRDISEKSFNENVAFIYQDVFLFEDTIRNNITLYKDIEEEQINYAIQVCGLDSVVAHKSEGIEERLTENGKNLSGGQRQRISIARAIAKKSQLLFVDEGTSSLNEELGKEIEKVFLELDNTVIAISHRFYEGVTDNYDYVLEVKNGRIHEYPAKDYFDEVITC